MRSSGRVRSTFRPQPISPRRRVALSHRARWELKRAGGGDRGPLVARVGGASLRACATRTVRQGPQGHRRGAGTSGPGGLEQAEPWLGIRWLEDVQRRPNRAARTGATGPSAARFARGDTEGRDRAERAGVPRSAGARLRVTGRGTDPVEVGRFRGVPLASCVRTVGPGRRQARARETRERGARGEPGRGRAATREGRRIA